MLLEVALHRGFGLLAADALELLKPDDHWQTLPCDGSYRSSQAGCVMDF